MKVNVGGAGSRKRTGWDHCVIGEDLTFPIDGLESYFFANWEPVVYDAMLVGAAAEYCDRTVRRPKSGWAREFELRVPVHEPDLWNSAAVSAALRDALSSLTGDDWRIEFYGRSAAISTPRQGRFNLGNAAIAVMPYSDGLDSRAVAGLTERELGDSLVRVRLGARKPDGLELVRGGKPFAVVPFKAKLKVRTGEPSARTRGFKFALITGLAAYLAKVGRIILPESGQGALGPTLVPVGQAYEDYRSHPLFTQRMERLIKALLDHDVRYEFPQLWQTKAQTLRAFVDQCDGAADAWADTRSCWQLNWQVSVNHRTRQCGVCAACMLRRVSVHAAGLEESPEKYVWEDLAAADFFDGAARDFDRSKITTAMREYAIAGTLHLDHLASIRTSPANRISLDLNIFQLSRACDLPQDDVRGRMDKLLMQHETEWKDFMDSLGPQTFLRQWARTP